MNRYIFAFVASVILYTSLIASIIYIAGQEDKVSQSKENVQTHRVAISMVQQRHCEHHKKKVEKKVLHKPVKKKVHKELKKVVKKPKTKLKPKPKVQPEAIVKEEVVTEAEEEVVAQIEKDVVPDVEEEVNEEEIEEEKIQQQLQEQKMQEMLIAKQKELDRFTLQLVKKINENKQYPLSARRRGVEGDVDVKFIVMANGGVDAIEIIQGKSIFKRSTMQAIEKSFPIDIEKSLLDFPKEFKIKLVYVLK